MLRCFREEEEKTRGAHNNLFIWITILSSNDSNGFSSFKIIKASVLNTVTLSPCSASLSLSLSLSHTQTLSLSLSPSLSLSLTHRHYLSLSLSLSHTQTLSLSLSLSLSLTHTDTISLSLSLSLSLSHSDRQISSNKLFQLNTYFHTAMRSIINGHACGCSAVLKL